MDGIKEAAEKSKEYLHQITHETIEANKEEKKLLSQNKTSIEHKKVNELSELLHNTLPLLQKAGFILTSLDVEVGFSPKFIPHFAISHHIEPKEQEELLKEIRHKHMMHAMLTALFKASNMKDVISVGEMKFYELEVHFCTIPKVIAKFN